MLGTIHNTHVWEEWYKDNLLHEKNTDLWSVVLEKKGRQIGSLPQRNRMNIPTWLKPPN